MSRLFLGRSSLVSSFIVLIVMLSPTTVTSGEPTTITPLPNAHAHNDYEHSRPLVDALDAGFTSVEADIWLIKGELAVAHTPFGIRSDRTLESLYLRPLQKRIKEHHGKVFSSGPPLILMIDIKTPGPETFAVLQTQLARYDSMLSGVRNGRFEQRAVTVIISGNCPRKEILDSSPRYAAIDGRPSDLDSTAPIDEIPLISTAWNTMFRWKGDGPMPMDERIKLREFVRKAHERGRQVRFWATPESVEVWKEQRAAGVDRLNTDRLDEMRKFLMSK